MIILISGATHTGKTLLAKKLSEKYHYQYLSLDLLKMGLIRSGLTNVKPTDDDERITQMLWPVVSEMIKTAIENGQDMIIEGCYIPFSWRDDIPIEYLGEIKYLCIIMSEEYIMYNFDKIVKFENIIENRKFPKDIMQAQLICENNYNLAMCENYGLEYRLIDKEFFL